jgi:hypothetical protein
MSVRILPYFSAIQDGYLFRIFVTASGLMCVRLGRGAIPKTRPSGSASVSKITGIAVGVLPGLLFYAAGYALGVSASRTARGAAGLGAGGLAIAMVGAAIGFGIAKLRELNERPNDLDESSKFKLVVNEQLSGLAKCDEADIHNYIKEKKRGYVLDLAKLKGAQIDYVLKWQHRFFGKPGPALILNHSSKGKLIFLFRKRSDLVIALFEMQQLFEDRLEVGVNTDDYRKALKKYEEIRNS